MNKFNTRLLQLRLDRIARGNQTPMLLSDILDDLSLRLAGIAKKFNDPLIFGPFGSALTPIVASSLVNSKSKISQLVLSDHAKLAPSGFDCVISICYLNLLNDLEAIFRLIHHILRPGGLLLAALIGGTSLKDLREALTKAELTVRQGAAIRIMPMIELQDLGNLIRDAGMAQAVVDSEKYCLAFDNITQLLSDIRLFGGNIIAGCELNPPLTRQILHELDHRYRQEFSLNPNQIYATFDVLWVTAWIPHN